MIFVKKILSVFRDWYFLNKLFRYNYYFDNYNTQVAKKNMWHELLWYNKPIKYWSSIYGLLYLLHHIFFINKQIPFDNKYGVKRYYNDNNIRLQTNNNKSNAYVWNYLKLFKQSQSNWTNNEKINNEKQYLENNYNKIFKMYKDYRNILEEHPENTTSLDSGSWSKISIYNINGWNNSIKNIIIDQIKNKFNIAYNHGFIFFSQTSKYTHIKGHYGSSNLRIRLHLGIDIPDKHNTIMNVSNEMLFWENGKVLAFDDSFYHSSHNKSDHNRTILIIDIFNPYLTLEECNILKNPILKNMGKLI
jgi:hypothetical protein